MHGQDLIDDSGEARLEALVSRIDAAQRVPRLVTGDADDARRFLEAALTAGHEGIMAKDPAAAYEAGRRGELFADELASRRATLSTNPGACAISYCWPPRS